MDDVRNNSSCYSSDEWVRFNVGGSLFMTTRSTLCKDLKSFLYRICDENSSLNSGKDEMGAFLIDRDPTYFGPILNFLRYGKLILSDSLSLEAVLEEAEFYNLTDLIRLCKQRITDRILAQQRNEPKKHVYRVIQCHQDELTQMLSTLSDGWKLEQLTSTTNNVPYENPEFICIVSRECLDPINCTDDQQSPGAGNGSEDADFDYQNVPKPNKQDNQQNQPANNYQQVSINNLLFYYMTS